MKAPGGALSRLQEHTLKELRKAGAVAAVVTSIEEVRVAINAVPRDEIVDESFRG